MELGGYFQLELQKGSEFHPELIPLNAARNCLDLILDAREFGGIFVPSYTCEAVFDVLRRRGISTESYIINASFEIVNPPKLRDREVLLYTNYFGLKGDYIKELSKTYSNLIIDNAQAFFCRPLNAVDSFYSCRKFFGVPDGAYLYSSMPLKNWSNLPQDKSSSFVSHLIDRIEKGASAGYTAFRLNEARIDDCRPAKMSVLTHALLANIDYKGIQDIRIRNYHQAHSALKELNKLNVPGSVDEGPMAYPFLSHKAGLRNFLIDKGVFVPSYWPNVIQSSSATPFEKLLATEMVAIPIDQRISSSDLNEIIAIIKTYLSRGE